MSRTDWICLLCLTLLASAFSWHTVHFDFMLDDYSWLEAGQSSDLSLSGLSNDGVAGFLRPAVTLTYAVMHALFDTRPEPQHALNILLHVACAGLTYVFLRCMRFEPLWSLAGAAIFGTHPAHDEVIAWVSARTSSLMTMMTLTALIAWARWPDRQGRRLVVALGCQAVALLCKEDAVVIPAVLMAVDWLVFGVPILAALRRSAWPIALCVVYLGLRLHLAPAADRSLEVSFGLERIGLGVVSRIPELFLPRRSLPVGLLYGLVISGLIFVLSKTTGSDRRRAYFGLTLCTLALLPSSILSFAATEDRYRYLATVGAALVWCCFLQAGRTGPGTAGRVGPGSMTLLKLVLPPLLCLQTYRLVRDLRYWDRRTEHERLTAAAIDLTPRLRQALEQGRRIGLGTTPLEDPHLRSLLVVYAAVQQREIVAPAAADLLLDWDPIASTFELRAR